MGRQHGSARFALRAGRALNIARRRRLTTARLLFYMDDTRVGYSKSRHSRRRAPLKTMPEVAAIYYDVILISRLASLSNEPACRLHLPCHRDKTRKLSLTGLFFTHFHYSRGGLPRYYFPAIFELRGIFRKFYCRGHSAMGCWEAMQNYSPLDYANFTWRSILSTPLIYASGIGRRTFLAWASVFDLRSEKRNISISILP